MYRDDWGIIVQRDGDGGDSAQRMGMWGFADVLQGCTDQEHLKASTLCKVGKGTFVRHPFQPEFRSDPKHFSRDQQDALVMYLGEHDRSVAWAALKNQLKRFGRYQNKDWANLATISVYIRTLKLWWLYPLLLITDLHFIFNTLFQWPGQYRNPDDVDDLNAVLRMLQATHRYPTPTAWLACKLYLKIRPRNHGCYGYVDSEGKLPTYHPVDGMLRWYFREEAGGNPEFAWRYWDIIKARF